MMTNAMSAPTVANRSAADLAAQRRAQVAPRVLSRRRRRVFWRILLTLLALALMISISVLQRDQQRLQSAEDNVAHLPAVLQRFLAADGFPRDLPPPTDVEAAGAPAVRRWRDALIYAPQNLTDANPRRSVAIVYPQVATALYTRANGRYIVTYDGASFRVEWFTEADLRDAASSLGIEPSFLAPPEQQ